jgi:hypothetical protein
MLLQIFALLEGRVGLDHPVITNHMLGYPLPSEPRRTAGINTVWATPDILISTSPLRFSCHDSQRQLHPASYHPHLRRDAHIQYVVDIGHGNPSDPSYQAGSVCLCVSWTLAQLLTSDGHDS